MTSRLPGGDATSTQVSSNDKLAQRDWFRRSRLSPDGQPLAGLYLKASRQRRKATLGDVIVFDKPAPPPGVNWTPVGPSVINSGFTAAGRVTCVLAGPAGTRVYAGAADGGVWFSADGGRSWAPLDDYFSAPAAALSGTAADANSLSTGAIEIRFGATAYDDEIFIGTGEPNQGWPSINVDVNPYDNYFGVGIRHRLSGTWTLEATNLASQGVYRICIDPNDVTPANVYAATTTGLFKRPATSPFTNWRQLLVNPTNINLPVTDFIAAGTGASRMFYAAVNGDNVYSSPDGITWTPLSGLGTIPNNEAQGRIALAASESNPNIVYALVGNDTLFRLDHSLGGTFQQVLNFPAALFGPFDSQQGYDLVVAVDPSDPTSVYLGGVNIYKGAVTLMGSSYSFPSGGPTYIGSGMHSDFHAITFALKSTGTGHDSSSVWVGCDGGVYQSGSSGTDGTFQSLNPGLAISQCYSFGQRSDTDAVVLTGLQDNGGLRMLSEQAALNSAGIIIGDGGTTVFHPTDPYRALMQYKRTGLVATTNGGMSWSSISSFPPSGASNSEVSATAFIAPMAAIADSSASGGAQLAFGTNRLWISNNWGMSWVTLPTGNNPYAVSPPNLSQDVIDPTASSVAQAVTAIAFASRSQVYAATAGQIWRYDFAGGSWTKTAVLPAGTFPAGYYITGIAVENAAAGSIYVSLGGASIPHVQYYDGSAWHAAMPTSVLDVPTHAVVVDPATSAVYVGTDVGCWKGIRTGTTWSWSVFSNGLPQCSILQLAIHQNANLLRAATIGRGIWEIPLNPAAVGLDPDIYMRVNYADTGRVVGGSRFPWVEGAADPITVGQIVYHWMSADIKVRRSSLSSLPPIGSPASYYDFAFNVGDYVQPSTNIETADVSGVDGIFVEVHNRSVNPVAAANVRVLLLVADASAALPALPSGWASHVNSGDVSSAWLGTSGWQFVDSASPYRTLNGLLDVRTPQVVEYQFDFSTLGLPPGHDHVCLAAFVTTVDSSDQITSTNTDLNTVTMTDKHVVHRNTHLVALGSKPFIPRSELIAINFNNPYDDGAVFDFEFRRQNFPGEVALLLPRLSELAPEHAVLQGFRLQPRGSVAGEVQRIIGDWIEHIGDFLERFGRRLEGLPPELRDHFGKQNERRREKLERLDHRHVLLAEAAPSPAAINGIHIPPRSAVLGAFAIQPPPGAKKNDRYRLDIIQRYNGKILGGSSYVIAIV